MPNKPRLPKYRKHKPSGQAVVTISGRDFYLGPHNSKASITEYDRLIAEWLAAGRRIPQSDEITLTVNELIVAYWEHCQAHYRKAGQPTSMIPKIKAALGPVRTLYGRKFATDFGPLALKACRQTMVDDGQTRGTINAYVGCICKMFKWGGENELVPASIYHGLQTVSGLQKGRSEVPEGDGVTPVADSLVDAVRPFVSRQVWAMIELQRLCGMRPGEVVNMRTIDIDRTGPVWIYVPESHKTEHHGRGREIYIGPQGQAILADFLKADQQAYLFSPSEAEEERRIEQRQNRKSSVPPSQRNRRGGARVRKPTESYRPDSYRRAIVRACELAFDMPDDLRRLPAGLPTDEKERRRKLAADWRAANCWSPNQLRHNAATKARKHGGLELSQLICGHANADVTQIYAERDRARAVEYMGQFG